MVSVINGYGSGLYSEGDMVYVFSRSLKEFEVFES